MDSKISFEIGSICDAGKVAQVYVALNAAQVFVTWRPNETVDQLLETCRNLASMGLKVVPHVVARNLASAAELRQLLHDFSGLPNINAVLILGGDAADAAGPYTSAADVIAAELLSTFEIKKVYFAGYPQGHSLIANIELDVSINNKIKLARQQNLQPGMITQLCSSAPTAINWALSATTKYDVEVSISIPIGENTVIKQRLKQIYKSSVEVEYAEHVRVGALAYLESALASLKMEKTKFNLHLIPFQKLDLLLRNGDEINTMLQSELS